MLNLPPVEPGVIPAEDVAIAAKRDAPPPEFPAPPPRGEQLAAAFRGTRQAWSPSLLAPLWIYSLGVWCVWESSWPREILRSAPLRTAAILLTIVLAWPPAVLAMALAAWEFGRGERLGLRAGMGLMGARLGSALGGPLLVVGGGAFLIALAAGGSVALAGIPLVGKALAACWSILPGVPLGLLAAGLLLVGVPALPLIIAAGAVEEPFPFEAAARGMSYLRGKPCRFLALLASSLAGAAAGTVVFSIFAGLLIGMGTLAGAPGLGSLDPGFAIRIEDLGGELGSFLSELAWPFAGLLGLPPPRGGQPAAVLIGRAVTAFAAASALAGLARVYLLIRWQVDGEPPGSQVRPGEQFDWEEE